MWGYTLEEAKPYLKYVERDLLFREAVIHFLINEKDSKGNLEDEFCKTCKKANPNIDCSSCNKKFNITREQEKKKIGK